MEYTNQPPATEDVSGSKKRFQAPMVEMLELFPEGACIIGPDYRISLINNRLKKLSGDHTGKFCHEVLAGASSPCPFCPFDLLIAGIVDPVRRAIQVRGRRTYCIDLHHIETGSGGMILETVRDISVDHELQERESAGAILPMLLKKLTGLLSIGRRLMGSAEFEDKMEAVLKELVASLGENSAAAWVEVDGVTYGASADSTQGLTSVQEIRVEGRPRGKLSVHWTQREDIRPEEKYFLEEAADLVGRQVEISDLWAKLRLSEERYRKLAGNLAKEMWSRTEALMKETGYLEGILRCSQDMIITTDLDSRIVEFNPGAEKMLGFTAEELQGRSISEIWVNGEERDRLMEEVILSGGIRNYETLLRTKTGETKEISLSLSLLKDEEGRILGTVGVSKEVGQENAIRRELERLNQNFREAIHFINHETKNSLIVMGGFLRRLLNSEADPSRKDQLKIVYHHSKFLEAMSRDFLVMAELEHGEFQIRKTLIRNFYKEVILPAMIGLKERYPDSFQSYDSSMGGVGDITLPGDPALLETVYRNLFGNALKYRYPDRKIAYGVTEYPDRYVFNVWNEGPGVPADETDKIFRKFYRVHDEHTKGKRGTGLGLYNIKRIIEAHGGRIWCETRPGVWINFLFELPKS